MSIIIGSLYRPVTYHLCRSGRGWFSRSSNLLTPHTPHHPLRPPHYSTVYAAVSQVPNLLFSMSFQQAQAMQAAPNNSRGGASVLPMSEPFHTLAPKKFIAPCLACGGKSAASSSILAELGRGESHDPSTIGSNRLPIGRDQQSLPAQIRRSAQQLPRAVYCCPIHLSL